ncbi:serine/threonine-protein kinase Nek4 isoform X1 [Neopelma chrysocephalum]|uniref:serine/threonine-protein kinase Nek4 isoform X1 n=2 Tax=Neopelma chrysocephalum TaxID=114329 RepID=UPI000FCD1DFC|nr:serine/threonine-protein kinase Nek4 isoform X1 [Neopelma chrysocephalum]
MSLAAYCFLRAVGKGSYGEVSLARHRQDRKQYVIKKLNLRNAPSRERRAAEQEAQLLSQLRHPNIVTYRESWQGQDGHLYIVMGFCEGGDLYHKLKEQKGKLLPESQVVEWFVQIAMALQYLHEKHILHRDLKTQNIFLTRTNIIKVGDLGIARVLENQYDMASTLIGTPYYMSPELFSNKPYNHKSDVWALGCCVYEMATLKHAFNAKDMNSLVYRIIEGKLPPMPKDYSPQLVAIIQTMLSKKPEERPSVKSILRQPYIKQQISLFLEATKAKAARNQKKTVNSKPKDPCSVISAKNESHSRNVTHQNHSPEQARKYKVNEEDCIIKYKATKFCPSEKPLVEVERKPSNNDPNKLGDSIATISEVNIDVFPSERTKRGSEKCSSECIPENNKAKYLNVPGNSKITSHSPPIKEDGPQQRAKQASKAEKAESQLSSVNAVEDNDDTLKLLQPVSKDHKQTDLSLDSTEELLGPFVPIVIQDDASHGALGDAQGKTFHLEPHSSVSEPSLSRQQQQKRRELAEGCSEKFRTVSPRPLPVPSDVNTRTAQRCAEQHGAGASEPGNGAKASQAAIPMERPLSARERRRLKQSREMLPSVIPARWLSNGAVVEAKSHVENCVKVAQSSSDPSISQKKREAHCLSDDELSSSTSSTDKSDGDSKERKNNVNEMNDLVQLMTWTLKMDSKENSEYCVTSTPAPEFKLHKKYRDTLILHGKLPDESEELNIEEIPSDMLTVPDKIRRMVEILRSDVVQGLGVKLLEEVYRIMEDDDEAKRELQLREHMGDKYMSYSAKARHLKFLEENVKL